MSGGLRFDYVRPRGRRLTGRPLALGMPRRGDVVEEDAGLALLGPADAHGLAGERHPPGGSRASAPRAGTSSRMVRPSTPTLAGPMGARRRDTGLSFPR